MVYILFIFGIIGGVISAILALLLMRTYASTKIKATLILFVLFCSISVNTFLFAVVPSLSKQCELIAYWTYLFLIISLIFAALLFGIFFEYIELGQIRITITFLFGILFGAFIAVLFIPGQVTVFYSEVFASWMIISSDYLKAIMLVFAILVIYRLIKGFIVIYRVATNERLKFQFKLFFSGISIGLTGLVISSASGILISEVNFVLGSMLRGLYPLFISIGLFIIFIGFHLNPYSIYLISQKVFQILVFNKSGVTIFDRQFRPTTGKHVTLITGAIHGVSSMIQHALGIESHPRSLKYLGRTLIFEFKGTLGFALISDRDSQILRNGLENFSELFMQAYKHELDEWDGSIETFENASDFIKKSFPFLDL
ncbi:MAG: hypothetical protein HWN65_20990 [Candidatus Helarchaeota archaeon]|nr:hypothetical protein [Candidatus Helarchaeota archaeon]